MAIWSLPRAGQSDFFAIDNRSPGSFNILDSALGTQNCEMLFLVGVGILSDNILSMLICRPITLLNFYLIIFSSLLSVESFGTH